MWDIDKEKARIINQILWWWKANLWNPERLYEMSLSQLVAIRQKAINTGWVQKTHPKCYGQPVMVPDTEETKRIRFYRPSHSVYTLDREKVLAHIAACKAALQGGKSA
jgi:hypothetical protein